MPRGAVRSIYGTLTSGFTGINQTAATVLRFGSISITTSKSGIEIFGTHSSPSNSYGIEMGIPWLSELFPLILKAVPKKKPSYRRTRQKLYAPGDKQIQPLNNLVRCPACGSVKRSHFMCMNCFAEIKQFLKTIKPKPSNQTQTSQPIDLVDEKILYPGKKLSDYQRRLAKKDWIPVREKPLMFDSNHVRMKK